MCQPLSTKQVGGIFLLATTRYIYTNGNFSSWIMYTISTTGNSSPELVFRQMLVSLWGYLFPTGCSGHSWMKVSFDTRDSIQLHDQFLVPLSLLLKKYSSLGSMHMFWTVHLHNPHKIPCFFCCCSSHYSAAGALVHWVLAGPHFPLLVLCIFLVLVMAVSNKCSSYTAFS